MTDPSPDPRRPLPFPSRFEWVKQAFANLMKDVRALHPLLDLLRQPEGETAFAEKLLASITAIERNTEDIQRSLARIEEQLAASDANIAYQTRAIWSLDVKITRLSNSLGLRSSSASTSSHS